MFEQLSSFALREAVWTLFQLDPAIGSIVATGQYRLVVETFGIASHFFNVQKRHGGFWKLGTC